MATKPMHPSQRPGAKPVEQRDRAVVKSMSEMSRLMQSKVAPVKKQNSRGR